MTSTLYDLSKESLIRSRACIKTIENAKKNNLKIVVADGWSNPKFIKQIKTFSNVELLDFKDNIKVRNSFGTRRRAGIKHAIKNIATFDFIFWIEPEKYSVLEIKNIKKITKVLTEQKPDIVILTPKPNDDRPLYMQIIEKYTTNLIECALQNKWNLKSFNYIEAHKNCKNTNFSIRNDYMFWPKLFTKKIASNYFLTDTHELWDGIIIPAINAVNTPWVTVSSLWINFKYGNWQKDIEQDDKFIHLYKQKRYKQSLVLYKAFLENFENNKLYILYNLLKWKKHYPEV